MRQRFFTSTAQTRLIKNILANTPIPIYDTVRPGDYIIKNCKYIYNITLIKCVKSGIIEDDAEFISLDYTFYWGVDKLNHTERLKDATGFYDSKVHEWLGRYLRAYRDMMNINLMPFYNCFSGVYTSRFKLLTTSYTNSYIDSDFGVSTEVGNKVTVYEADQSYDTYSQGSEQFNSTYVQKNPYKILQIPIKLNKTYTIAVDCDSVVKVAPAFINHGHLVKVSVGTSKLDLTEILIDNKDEQGIVSPISFEKTNTVFLKPFTIEINSKSQIQVEGITTIDDIGLTYEQLLQRYEKYLYLLIQLPRSNTSSVVVLEGDYTDISEQKIFSLENVKTMSIDVYDELHTYTTSVIKSESNTDLIKSKAPYVAQINVENQQLSSIIVSMIPEQDYGYLEYFIVGEVPAATCLGDVNLNGRINARDFGLIDDYLQGVITLTPEQLANADINRDGLVTTADIEALIDMISEVDSPLGKPAPACAIVQVYSYVPISVGTKFTVKWYNLNTSEKELVTVNNDIEDNCSLLDKYLLSRLTLLQLNDEKNYPFADRLIEYLTLNVIDSADEISNNVKLAQNRFNSNSISKFAYGAWNNPLRMSIYKTTMNDNSLTHLDMNGYVDKTVESIMK